MSKLLLIPLILSFSFPGKPLFAAETPQFIFPAACAYAKDCWAVNYLDVDPNEKSAEDFQCNSKTYDNHTGTDIALGSIERMNEGVDVLAAASGKVLRTRDSENDILKSPQELVEIRKKTKECGNGVVIDHGNDLQTMYCHLKSGSVIVKPGDNVTAGQKIAQIGQSGLAEFPHLHFGVTMNGKVTDPFTGLSNQENCGNPGKSLWAEGQNIIYDPAAIFDGGFQDSAPDFTAVQTGEQTPKQQLPKSSEAFILWAGFYNVEKGDIVTIKIITPNGEVYASDHINVNKTRSRQYYFIGKKTPQNPLQEGKYIGEIKLIRKDNLLKSQQYTVTVTP